MTYPLIKDLLAKSKSTMTLNPVKRRRKRNPTADSYVVALDALEDGRPEKEVRKLAERGREEEPEAHIPDKLRGFFFDEAEVAADMAHALGEDIEEGDVEEEDLHGETVFKIDLGRREYYVALSEESAREAALASVKQDLEHEPEIFQRGFIESHINMDALKDWVKNEVMEDSDYVHDLADDPERFWRDAAALGIDLPDEDENGEMPDEVDEEYIDAYLKAYAEDRARDPMGYIIEYRDEAVTEAIRVAGINVEAAAEDAVDTDGWEHYLSHYDGKSASTPAGFVYWRTS